MSTTTPDLGKLERDARQAAEALAAAKDEQAAAAAVVAAERQARSVNWAFRTCSQYAQRQAEATYRVEQLLGRFDETLANDYAAAPALYVAIAQAMAEANGLGVEYAKARAILRQAGLLAPQHPGHREDPVGHIHAPFPPNTALPPFGDLVASSLERARIAAFRAPQPSDDPGAFAGQVSDAEREAVKAYEWTLSQDLEALLALREQFPDRFARNVSEADKVNVAAYAVGRLARGYDAPLPKMYAERLRHDPPAPPPDPGHGRITLYQDGLVPRPHR